MGDDEAEVHRLRIATIQEIEGLERALRFSD